MRVIEVLGPAFLALALGACSSKTPDAATPEAGAPEDAGADVAPASALPCPANDIAPPPSSLGLDPFYTRHLDAVGIPIVSSDAPDPRALVEACLIVRKMLEKRDDVRLAMIARKARVAVMGKNQVTLDIPEHADLQTEAPGTDWNTRARGLGGTVDRPATSCAEENLLCLPGDVYKGENILVHELAHGMYGLGIIFADKTFAGRLKKVFEAAIASGLWTNTYAATNIEEYWAEGVQDWFDDNIESIPSNGIHNEINTRAELAAYDPKLHALIAEIYTDEQWTPVCP